MEEGEARIVKEETTSFEIPIRNPRGVTKLKNMSPSCLPNFNGFVSKELDVFLYEFNFTCRSYDYVSDA
jgi:hypothetical protein